MTIDSTIEFEKRRNVPIRYNRELVQTTLQAMKRIGEIKQRRERAFWKNRMAVARERLLAHRRKKRLTEKPSSVKLLEPMAVDSEVVDPTPEKIKVRTQRKSALIPGEGRSMAMDMD